MRRIWLVFTMLALLLPLTVLGAAAEGEGAAVEQTTFAEDVSAFVTAHLPELLSAMTLIGTGVLTWLFKKSVLPVLERGLGKIGGGVESLSEEAKTILDGARAESERLAASAEALTLAAETDAARVQMLEGELADLRARSESERQELRALVQSSIAMMKEVFTAARLPAASKMALEEIYRSICSSGSDIAEKI